LLSAQLISKLAGNRRLALIIKIQRRKFFAFTVSFYPPGLASQTSIFFPITLPGMADTVRLN
jgi:hypothetical protein